MHDKARVTIGPQLLRLFLRDPRNTVIFFQGHYRVKVTSIISGFLGKKFNYRDFIWKITISEVNKCSEVNLKFATS